jgi:uncharacterized DUF497 family protein
LSSVEHGRGAACTKRGGVRKIGIVEFEFDPWKSESNKAKHGIDFVEVQALWKSKHVILGAKDTAEKRHLVIGTINHEHWSAIITYRGARIRIISVRKSTAAENHTYEKLAG